MYRDYKIIAVTPAGRKCYLELLIPKLLEYAKAGVLDEYHLWVNTLNKDDIAYMEFIAQKHSDVIKLVRLPNDVPYRQNMSIYTFFKNCVDDNTIYVRFDDDIVCLDTADAFKGFLDYRIDNPQWFMVYANILNNAVIAHILQRLCKLDNKAGYAEYTCMDPVGWKDGKFAANIHDQILKSLDNNTGLQPFRFDGTWRLWFNERVSINCLAWIGNEFRKQCSGIVGTDEEREISVLMPQKRHMQNVIYGNYCVVHYAFHTQREYCDKNGYLDRYVQRAVQN